jgi:hypothetical protein
MFYELEELPHGRIIRNYGDELDKTHDISKIICGDGKTLTEAYDLD